MTSETRAGPTDAFPDSLVATGHGRMGTAASERARAARRLGRVLIYVVLAAASLVFVFPLAFTVSMSLKSDAQLFVNPPVWIPHPVVPENYVRGWTTLPFSLFLRNTMVVVIAAATGQVLSCSLVAFGFSRLRGPGRDLLFAMVLATMMLPGQVTMVPTYILFRYLGWVDTFLPLTVPAWLGGSAFFIFLLRQFMLGITTELDDAARIDGAGNFRIYWDIVLPLTKPALGAVAIFSFVSHWNDFLYPLIYLNSQENYTLALGLRIFQLQVGSLAGASSRIDVQGLMAVSLLALVPVVAVFFVAQKQFIQGITFTGMKG